MALLCQPWGLTVHRLEDDGLGTRLLEFRRLRAEVDVGALVIHLGDILQAMLFQARLAGEMSVKAVLVVLVEAGALSRDNR
jgi:hypothetical protein